MDVSDLHAEVPLPRSAEKLLDEICAKHNLPPADAELRRKLASAGEDRALQVLRTIADSTTKVRSLPGFATHLFRQSPSPPPPPQSSPSRSPAPENPRPYDSPGTLITNSPGTLITNSPARRNGGEAPEMEALGELEFRKQFLILNYIGGNELQSVTTAEEIRSLKPLSMVQFEKQVWQRFGQRFVDPVDRRIYHDWESGKTHKYHCHVSPEGSYRFKGPYVEKTKTHLQKVIGDDNVLMVKFAEEAAAENFSVGSRDQNYAGYSKICREGIWVGLRRYCFFVFKDGGKEEKKKDPTSSPVKCYFVRINSNAWIDQSASYILSNRTISEARHLFMHARTVSTVSNYMVRFSLILSKTLTLKIDLSSVNIDIIEDEYCQDKSGNRIYRDGKPLIHTDGTGFISEDLALLCPKNLYRGKFVDDQNNKILHTRDEREDNVAVMEHRGTETLEPPLLMQFRMFNQGHAVKGTCLVNRKLELKTIKIRRSMVKVEPDPELSNYQTANSLEIVGTSNPPKKTHLSRNLIALLSCGGVPEKYFKHLVWNTLRESHGAFNSKRTAIRVAINQGGLDNGSIVARMILSGIPLEEPFLQHRLSVLVKEERKGLRGGKLSVDDCFYLMGTADPTGKLEHDEVCIILANGQVSGKVLVYRNPGLHFGDIHVLKATYIEEEELESFVGNAKYAIFFSRKGPRSIADEIATGDFDGDMYWVSRNPELLKHFKPSAPWVKKSPTGSVESKRPTDYSNEELEDELIRLFLKARFEPSFATSEAANSWLALVDRFLTLGDDCIDEKNTVKENLNKLIDIYYDALDAPKQGGKVEVPRELKPKMLPHYMEKDTKRKEKRQNYFHSKSILGWIYDEVDSYQSEDPSNKEIFKLPHFEVEVPEACLTKWAAHYKQYRGEMHDALQLKDKIKNEAADEVIKKYKRLLYDAEELEESTKKMEEINNEALAIYSLCYDYAISQEKVTYCSFAWNVAGSALLKLHAFKTIGERAFFCLASVLKEVL